MHPRPAEGFHAAQSSPDERAADHEAALFAHPEARRAAGRFYTPDTIADRLVAAVGPSTQAPPAAIVDPACGAGALLLAAVRHLLPDPEHQPRAVRVQLAERLRGVDIDPRAVAIARSRIAQALHLQEADLPEDALRVADGLDAPLVHDLPASQPRWILLNPPFGNAIRKETARDDDTRARWQARFPLATVGAFDRAWVFVARALELAGPHGQLGLILPRAFAAAPSAAPLRDALAASHTLTALEVLPSDTFRQAQVATVLAALEPREHRDDPPDTGVRSASATDRNDTWAGRLAPPVDAGLRAPASAPTLGQLFTLQACATAGEAYPLRDLLRESTLPAGASNAPCDGLRFLTTGAIEPGLHTWADRPQRYLRRKLARPVVSPADLPSGRLTLQRSPKVLVAGLSRVLEAFTDTSGDCAGAVAVIAVTEATAGDLFAGPGATGPRSLLRVEAWLNSSPARAHYRRLHGPSALAGDSVPVSKKPLGALPIPNALFGEAPADGAQWDWLYDVLGDVVEPEAAAATWKALPDEPTWERMLRTADALGEAADASLLRAALDRVAASGPVNPAQAAERRLRLDVIAIAVALGDGWSTPAR